MYIAGDMELGCSGFRGGPELLAWEAVLSCVQQLRVRDETQIAWRSQEAKDTCHSLLKCNERRDVGIHDAETPEQHGNATRGERRAKLGNQCTLSLST
jgi:hypothetical protein